MASKFFGTYKTIGLVALCAALGILAGCATVPMVRTQTAVGANLVGAHTFAYVKQPGTDSGPYHSLTTQRLEHDVTQQMEARGYTLAVKGQKPDLLVDFHITTQNRIEGGFAPMFSAGYWGPWGWGWGPGWGWPYGPGWGWGGYYNDVQTVTSAALTITVINAQDRMALWSGTTTSYVTSHMMYQHPNWALGKAVRRIFAHYPVRAAR